MFQEYWLLIKKKRKERSTITETITKQAKATYDFAVKTPPTPIPTRKLCSSTLFRSKVLGLSHLDSLNLYGCLPGRE